MATVSNISDITKNFRVLISPNQASSKFFDIAYIRKVRLQFLYASELAVRRRSGYMEEVKTIDLDTKRKQVLLDEESKCVQHTQSAIEGFVKEVRSRMDDIRGGCDART